MDDPSRGIGGRAVSDPSRPEIAIRVAAGSDGPAIARLIRRAKADAMPWLATPHSVEEDLAWVSGVLLPGHEVRVAVAGDGVIAVIALSVGWVDQLYVAPAMQGHGVGSRLLREAKDAAPGSLRLWTFRRNRRARAFYEGHGFVEVGRTDGDNEEHEPDVLYRWPGEDDRIGHG
jgi:GNAT superfamily N-acetyltransferase